ncbi:MAG: DUF393 domain-containing protein [Thiobacillus sp.]|nr:DUF393 domain-containing protein [Thiobacillus sp.]
MVLTRTKLVRVRTNVKRIFSGTRAFAALWQMLPAFRLAGRVAALPGIVHVLEWGYRGFLKVRRLWHRKAPACPVPDSATKN